MRIELCDGKYTYVINDDGSDQHALRYGERWRDLVGDGFVLAMAHEISEQQEQISELESHIKYLMEDCRVFNMNELKEHNLHMQAKGIEDLIVWFEGHCNKWGLAHSLENIAPNYAEKLRNQAKRGDV